MPTFSNSAADVVIRCERIGKRYRLGERQRYRALRETIAGALRAPLDHLRSRREDRAHSGESLWALRDVSFEIRRGEVLGIVGRNGAGKSTLLRVLARITKPTEGCAEVSGRVGALLELGTAFHPELTGRENIYLKGAILGMSRSEIRRKFDEIVEFSECAAFLDTPMKHYSSGMHMRLAFSVAAHLEAEILLVDEALAVGDAAFQQKCLGKMNSIAHAGRTVLFVSHNVMAVNSLCTRAICLEQGQIVLDGAPADVTADYLRKCIPPIQESKFDTPDAAPGNDVFRLRRVRVRSLGTADGNFITVRTPVLVEIDYWQLSTARLEVWVDLYTALNTHLFETGWSGNEPSCPGLYRTAFTIPGDFLNDGRHSLELTVHVGLGGGNEPLNLGHVAVFRVHDSADLRDGAHGAWPGALRPRFEWSTEQVEQAMVAPAGAAR